MCCAVAVETDKNLHFCIVRLLEVQGSIRDEYDCPIAILSNEITSVLPSTILRPVSIIH